MSEPGNPTASRGTTASDPDDPGTADLELNGQLFDEDDYTYYVDLTRGDQGIGASSYDADGRYREIFERRKQSENTFSASCRGKVFAADSRRGLDVPHNEGRFLICRCYAGKSYAVTVRRKPGFGLGGAKKRRKCGEVPWHETACHYFKKREPGSVPFAVETDSLGKKLDELIFRDGHPTGLVLITGATNSGKSELTQSLIYERVLRQHDQNGRKRWPHVVTFEDPIEQFLFKTSEVALNNGVEYTPRQKGSDVATLEDALEDALRQTPSLFFVGEIRKDREWAQLLRFAGTGHLVVATSHAGSLVEAMERIFRGVKAETPADRGQIAQRILAVVHQLKFDLRDLVLRETGNPLFVDDASFDVLLPALWRRTPGGVAALVSDGLASVLPNNPGEKDLQRISSLGRRWFVESLDTSHWTEVVLADRIRATVEHVLRAGPAVDHHDSWMLAEKHRAKLLSYAAVVARKPDAAALGTAAANAFRAMKLDEDNAVAGLAAWAAGPLGSKEVGESLNEREEEAGKTAEAARLCFRTEAVRYDLLGV